MDSQKFLDAFGHIADAPGGVARLRELILQLAISGSLVPKDENDASVEMDLAQARMLHSEYVEALELRKTVPHPSIESFPFSLPSHWAWERLERLCLYVQRGKGPSYVDRSSTRVISQKCIQWSGFDLAPSRFVSDDAIQGYGPERLLRNGDLLWNSTGTGTAGRIAIYDNEEPISAVSDSHVTVIRLANFEPRYVWCVIAAPWIQVRINPDHPDSLVSGTTQQVELATNAVRALEIPCPPIGEQKRIVAKVEELMALCDQLEKQQEARRTLRVKARKALIQAVASALTSGEVLAGWGKLTDHFAELFSSPEDVEHLRGFILDLAVRGELVPQSPEDESALDWFEQLGGKRTFLGGHVTDPPFELPNGWGFFHLGSITDKIGSGSTPRGGREVYVRNGVTFLRSQNVWNDGLRLQDVVGILPEVHKKMAGSAVRPKDILLNITGASLGRCALVPDKADDMNVSQHVTIIRPKDEQIRHYLHLCMLSPYVQSMVRGRQVGMAREGLSKKVLEQFEIPLPPIAEQKRIVARVDELMRLSTTMEKQLHDARSTAEALAQAAVASITGIAITEEEAELKAPQTELIAPLRIGTPPGGAAQAPLASILIRHSGALSARDLWQRFGGEIDSFYAQLKHEVAHGWIVEPEVAEMREQETA